MLWDRSVKHDVREALFGGRGAVRVWGLGSKPMAPFTALIACELEPGAAVGRHVQAEDPETVIVLEGHGTATVGDEKVPLTEGAVVFLPHGDILALENGSDSEPLRYFIIKAKG